MVKVERDIEGGVLVGYFAKGLHAPESFMAAVKAVVEEGDPPMANEPYETCLRHCRDFKRKCTVLRPAHDRTRGAFQVMYVDTLLLGDYT